MASPVVRRVSRQRAEPSVWPLGPTTASPRHRPYWNWKASRQAYWRSIQAAPPSGLLGRYARSTSTLRTGNVRAGTREALSDFTSRIDRRDQSGVNAGRRNPLQDRWDDAGGRKHNQPLASPRARCLLCAPPASVLEIAGVKIS
jgi:hypothetical protein